jgi:hypothetical protein
MRLAKHRRRPPADQVFGLADRAVCRRLLEGDRELRVGELAITQLTVMAVSPTVDLRRCPQNDGYLKTSLAVAGTGTELSSQTMLRIASRSSRFSFPVVMTTLAGRH